MRHKVLVTILVAVALATVSMGSASGKPAPGSGSGGGGVGALFDAAATINASGGTNATDGLKITYGSGQLQVGRLGTGQVYDPTEIPGSTTDTQLFNGIYLAVGTTTVGPLQNNYSNGTQASSVEWDTITTTGGSASGNGTIHTVLTKDIGGRSYVVDVTFSYTFPNDYFTATAIVTIPPGNTDTVRLYHEIDTYLGGSDAGPGFFQAGPPAIVGVQQTGVVEAFRYASGPAWAGYYSALYSDMSDGAAGAPNNGKDFANVIDPNPATDNGIAIDYNLGSTPGATTLSYDLIFSASLGTTPAATAVAKLPSFTG